MAKRTAMAEMLQYNLWANLRLIDLCAELSDEQLDASVPGTYGRVRDTLVHVAAAECNYAAALTGKEPPFRLRPGERFPGFDALQELVRWSGETLTAAASDVDPAQVLRGTWRGEPYEIPAVIFMIQAVNHAIEHRAQIKTILSQHGIQPPELDGWEYREVMANR